MDEKFEVTPKGIIYRKKLTDSRNPNAYSEEVVIPRDIFIEAYEKFINHRNNKRKKNYIDAKSNDLLVYHEQLPEWYCACGSNEFVHEYDEYTNKLYVLCKHCGYMGELLSESYIIATLATGDWRYEDDGRF